MELNNVEKYTEGYLCSLFKGFTLIYEAINAKK